MNMNVLLLSVFCSLVLVTNAQDINTDIFFERSLIDLGKLSPEDMSTITTEFKYRNNATKPFIIYDVQTSGQCRVMNLDKKPVLPGQSGILKVNCNLLPNTGIFSDSLVLLSNFKGVRTLAVKAKTSVNEQALYKEYPFIMGGLRLSKRHVDFSFITPEDSKTVYIDVINVSEKVLSPKFTRYPSYIRIKAEPEILRSDQKGKIIIVLDASESNNWGEIQESFLMAPDGKSYSYRLSYHAHIREDYSGLSAKEIKQAPVAVFKDTVHYFGKIRQGEKAEYFFKLTNTGKSNLIIRHIDTSCGCTAAKPEKNTIPPGNSIGINVIFNSVGRKGSQVKTLKIYTNDPIKPMYLLKLVGSVES